MDFIRVKSTGWFCPWCRFWILQGLFHIYYLAPDMPLLNLVNSKLLDASFGIAFWSKLKFHHFVCYIQEIGFDPCIVCKHLDKGKAFQLNQEFAILYVWCIVNKCLRWFTVRCFFSRFKMGTLYTFRKLLQLKAKKNMNILMSLHFWNIYSHQVQDGHYSAILS